jgi:(R,R)-butanediol dehydrogenase / meso-butanediol dehydrogenase / diacetyl reductase
MTERLPRTVKAVRWHGLEDMRLDSIAIPELKDDQVLVRNYITGICGTDRHTLHDGTFVDNSPRSINYPAILGHESSGEIIALGNNVTTDLVGQPIKAGDMTVFFEVLSCGSCHFCRQGNWNVCRRYMGAALKPGTLVEYYTYRSTQLIKAEGITHEQAALVEPSSCALHSTRLADPKIGDTVVIIGGGCIGLLRLQMVKKMGATKIMLVEAVEGKRKLALELGADIVLDPAVDDVVQIVASETLEGYGADVVFEDAGLPETQELAIRLARPHGTVMISGISPKPVTFNFFDQVQLRELRLLGSIGTGGLVDRRNDYLVVIDLIKKGQIKTAPIITSVFSLDDYKEAFAAADDSSRAIKVMIRTVPGA